MRIAVLLTCFNRRDITLKCLRGLATQTGIEDLSLEVFLVDDGSTDGTSDAVAREFPKVHLIQGNGSLFWNGGMHKAFGVAMRQNFDGYIWLNDDTSLYPDAISRLIAAYRRCKPELDSVILVGSVQDPETGSHTYGGVSRRPRGFALDFTPVPPSKDAILACDSSHANFTFVSAAVAKKIGNFDTVFQHNFGDFDYGFRATKQGVPVRIAPGYFGTCAFNTSNGSWKNPALSLAQRWKIINSPKGLPAREWIPYTRRHFGWRWPLYALSPYIKMLFGR
jgi:GT2 family glycosyltransferase